MWLRSGFAVHAIGESGVDDALFLRLARNLGAGMWLGAFDNTTLVKGMAYPAFILMSFVAGVPLKLAEQAVYLGASAAMALLVARTQRSRTLGTALFAALAFNPVLWTADLSRVIREGLYVGLSLAVVAAAAAVATAPAPARLGTLGRGLALGVLGGAFWLTREEGVWLVPAVAVAVGFGLVGASRAGARAAGLGARLLPIGVAGLGFVAVVGAVMAMNARVYGVAQTVEVKSPAFERAYGALSRIAHQHWRRYVVFPADARQLAYQVSPAARELAPWLDGPTGERWRQIGCKAAPMPECSEIQASWFQWALRDAVRDAGHYASLPEAARFYTQLADEIDAGCDRGAISCLPSRTGLMPPFRSEYAVDALGVAARIAANLLQPGRDIRRDPSIGLDVSIDLFSETVGPVSRGVHSWLIVDAWVGAREGVPMLALRPPAGGAIQSEIGSTAADDGPAAPFPLQRVKLVTDCPPTECDLVIEAGGRVVDLGRLDALSRTTAGSPDVFFALEGAYRHISSQGQERRAALIERIARGIGWVYASVLPGGVVLGAAGLAWAVLRGGRAGLGSPVVVLASASLVAVASRVALLAYLDVSSIASQSTLYASPASPFVIVFAVLGTALLVSSVRGWRHGS